MYFSVPSYILLSFIILLFILLSIISSLVYSIIDDFYSQGSGVGIASNFYVVWAMLIEPPVAFLVSTGYALSSLEGEAIYDLTYAPLRCDYNLCSTSFCFYISSHFFCRDRAEGEFWALLLLRISGECTLLALGELLIAVFTWDIRSCCSV